MFRTRKRRRADGRSYPWIVAETGVVNQYYVYCVDEDFGPFFLKFSTYFPYNAKLCINGQYAERPAMPHEAETRPVALGSRMRETAFLCRLRRPDLVACPSLWCPSPTSMEQERS